MRLNYKRSRELAEHVEAVNKACWRNAFLGALSLGDDARYVEGWVITDMGMVIEHGWVQRHGQIIDPTPTYHQRGRKTRYFAAVKFTPREALAANESADSLPFTMWTDPRLREAYRRAHTAAYGHTPEELHAKLDAMQPVGKPGPGP